MPLDVVGESKRLILSGEGTEADGTAEDAGEGEGEEDGR